MSVLRRSTENYRSFILSNVERYPNEIAKKLSDKFKISRQAANKHLQKLLLEDILTMSGNTKSRTYSLKPQLEISQTYFLQDKPKEDVVWARDIKPNLGLLPDNVMNIWNYCFTEMFNNVIDHSGASIVTVDITKSAVATEIVIIDNGVGIFKKIQNELHLEDERHAVLELAKGKFTTDPQNHSGEGIFFSSRACDDYTIYSGGVHFSHDVEYGDEDWILEAKNLVKGTAVFMKLKNHSSRKLTKIFDDFADIDYGFNKTIVPVALAQYGDELIVSRSQAKRLLNRIDRFKTVILDFKGVDAVGQAFADEIFRVFASQHPEVSIHEVNANKDISNMISRARQVNLS